MGRQIVITILAYDIEYETDGVEVDLPDRMEIEVELESGDRLHPAPDLNTQICEHISDETGWLVLGYKVAGLEMAQSLSPAE